jgi:hypothetical protein
MRSVSVPRRLYPRVLGEAWSALHSGLQGVHTRPGPIQAHAQFTVWRRPGRIMGWLLDLGRVPAAGRSVPVELTIAAWDAADGPRERWRRSFGGQRLVTEQSWATGGLLAERIGPLEFRFRLLAEEGSLLFVQRGCWLRLGRSGLPLPGWLVPIIWCRESGTDIPEQTVVAVTVSDPGGGVLFSYRGIVEWGGLTP